MMITKADMSRRARLYALLSRLYRVEVDAPLLDALKAMSFPTAGNEDLAEGYAMLRTYLDCCGGNAPEDLAVDYATVFLAAGSADGAAAIPCESVYTSAKKIFMQEAWEDVCGLYARSGLTKDTKYADLMEDHIALELEFMAGLCRGTDLEAQKDFLDRHLLSWIPGFVSDIEKYARADFYKAVGRITLGFLRMDRAMLDALSEGSVKQAASYSVRAERMDNIFARLRERYRIFAPKRFAKRGPKGTDLIRYGEIRSMAEIVHNEKSHFSPKEVFYPISQTMFLFKEDVCTQKELEDDKDIILFARPCDVNAIRRLDNIFLRNGNPDLYYSRMREKLHIFMLECKESFDSCFCVSMGSNVADEYSVAVRIDDICALVEVKDEAFLPYFADEVPIDFAPQFVRENKRTAKLPQIANRETLGEICKSDYWAQYDEQCIGCGGCNTVCPTCSCFDTVDVIYDETSRDGERRRVWSSCMLQDFTRTAGGGMARKTPGANMRFKVLHKVYDYNQRFGGSEHMCVGCGRCVDRCPRNIDYLDAVNGLAELLEKEDN
ncbi:MAG: anaerobic sulfite reductase subunit AsrA [Oscillospiraceae bacterium]|nr:anaerobic sulfite reductase subunit AsrA [Oscillospiraceae bacterium]